MSKRKNYKISVNRYKRSHKIRLTISGYILVNIIDWFNKYYQGHKDNNLKIKSIIGYIENALKLIST